MTERTERFTVVVQPTLPAAISSVSNTTATIVILDDDGENLMPQAEANRLLNEWPAYLFLFLNAQN